MNNKTPSQSVLYPKPGQRKAGRGKPAKAASQWQPHLSDCAIDPWGVAIRVLKEQKVDFNQ